MYDDDSRYYFQKRRQIINTVIQRAVNVGDDKLSKDLRQMMGIARKGDRNDNKPPQPHEQKDAPRT